MKILIVRMFADVLNINNYNCQEIGLAKSLIKKGNKCDIVLFTDKDNYEEDYYTEYGNIHIYYYKARKFLNNCFFDKKLTSLFDRYDIIQSAEYDQLANIKLYRMLGNKFYIYHGPYKSSYTKGYNIKCFISDIIIFFNKKYKSVPILSKSELATKFLRSKGFKSIKTVGVGLDFDNFKNINIEKKDLKNDFIYLLYVGKLEDRRNPFFLIDLIEKLEDKYRLIIVGTGDKDYISKFWDYVDQKNVKNKIIYYERLSQRELPPVYKKSSFFLFPSNYEIFGMVLLEAMYFGNIVISSFNGGSSTLIKNGENGFICDECLERWIDCIESISNNETQKETLSSAASNLIKHNFSWDALSSSFISEYDVLLKKNNSYKK